MPSILSAQSESNSIEVFLLNSNIVDSSMEETTCNLTAPYVYDVNRFFNGYEQEALRQQRPKLMPTDKFDFIFNVVSRSVDSNFVRSIKTLLHHRNEVGCRIFSQEEEGMNFLRSNLFHKDFPNEWREQIIKSAVPQVKQMFEFDESSADEDNGNSSDPGQSRVFRLQLEILLV